MRGGKRKCLLRCMGVMHESDEYVQYFDCGNCFMGPHVTAYQTATSVDCMLQFNKAIL